MGRTQFGYITCAFYVLRVPILGRIQYGYIKLPSTGSLSGEKSIRLHHPCLLGVPMMGKIHECYISPALSGSP